MRRVAVIVMVDVVVVVAFGIAASGEGRCGRRVFLRTGSLSFRIIIIIWMIF